MPKRVGTSVPSLFSSYREERQMLLIDYLEELCIYDTRDIVESGCAIVTSTGKVFSFNEIINLLVNCDVVEINHSEDGFIEEICVRDSRYFPPL